MGMLCGCVVFTACCITAGDQTYQSFTSADSKPLVILVIHTAKYRLWNLCIHDATSLKAARQLAANTTAPSDIPAENCAVGASRWAASTEVTLQTCQAWGSAHAEARTIAADLLALLSGQGPVSGPGVLNTNVHARAEQSIVPPNSTIQLLLAFD